MRRKILGFDTCGDTIWDTIHNGYLTKESLIKVKEDLAKLEGFFVNIEIKAWNRKRKEKMDIDFAIAMAKSSSRNI